MPDIFEMLNSSIYVEDVFYGADSVETTFKLNNQAYSALGEARMNLQPFSKNSIEFKKNSGMIVG